ncbi:MAG TPA: multicopper oxidase domain-containing protein, partial [Steroidobacteraceae bacterium]|nr:multicopper oxidase domain-containing protein [Steroidobacteraceae bacterium]
FELRRLGIGLAADSGRPLGVPRELRGVLKDVVLVDANTRTDVEFTADHPGPSLFHCHQQNHMDMGFMMLFRYG